MSDDLDWVPDESLEWGPKRPPAVSWAGGLLLLLSLVHLGVIGGFAYIDREAILASRPDTIVVGSVLALFALQLLSAVAVLRLWRWWRGIAILLSLAAIVLGVVNLPRTFHVPLYSVVIVAVEFLYALVIVLLARSRAAFA